MNSSITNRDHVIAVRDLFLRYGNNVIIDHINIQWSQGIHVILGSSGVGKSTLLRIVAGLSAPTHGQVDFLFDPKESAPFLTVDMLTQQPMLLPMFSVRYNVTLCATLQERLVSSSTVNQVLSHVGLGKLSSALVGNLSGGEKQRVALARILLSDAPVILLDEPFCALDVVTRVALHTLVVDLFAERCVVMVTHDPFEAARVADSLWLMRERTLKPIELPFTSPPPRPYGMIQSSSSSSSHPKLGESSTPYDSDSQGFMQWLFHVMQLMHPSVASSEPIPTDGYICKKRGVKSDSPRENTHVTKPALAILAGITKRVLSQAKMVCQRCSYGVFSTVLILCVWHGLVYIADIPSFILPSPWLVAQDLWHLPTYFFDHWLVTFGEIVLGMFLGTFVGICVGITMTLFSALHRALWPMLVAAQVIPVFALAPILVMYLGYGLASKVAMAVLIVFFPVCVGVYRGLVNLPPWAKDMLILWRAQPLQALWSVRWPLAVPMVGAGMRTAAAAAPIAAIVGEWVGSSSGLGYVMLSAGARVEIPRVFAALFLLIITAVIFYSLIDRAIVYGEKYFSTAQKKLTPSHHTSVIK